MTFTVYVQVMFVLRQSNYDRTQNGTLGNDIKYAACLKIVLLQSWYCLDFTCFKLMSVLAHTGNKSNKDGQQIRVIAKLLSSFSYFFSNFVICKKVTFDEFYQ